MKEISQELEDREVAICVTCGAIFEGVNNTFRESCPECGSHLGDGTVGGGLYWITPEHTWMVGLNDNDH